MSSEILVFLELEGLDSLDRPMGRGLPGVWVDEHEAVGVLDDMPEEAVGVLEGEQGVVPAYLILCWFRCLRWGWLSLGLLTGGVYSLLGRRFRSLRRHRSGLRV